MTKKVHLLAGVALVAFGVLLSGCEMGKSSSQSQEVLAPERPSRVITGEVSLVGEKLFITQKAQGKYGDPDGVPKVTEEIVSRKVDLKNYVGKTVTVSGEYSGTTLYVDEIK